MVSTTTLPLSIEVRTVPLILLISISLAGLYAGFNQSNAVPIHDKLQHFLFFLCFGLTLYWIPMKRKRAIQITVLVAFTASVSSEFIQDYLTSRAFDVLDIVSNCLGSAASLLYVICPSLSQ